MLKDKINKLYIIIILIMVFLNWNFNYIQKLGENYETFFISYKISLIFKNFYPIIEKIIKVIFYLFTAIYICINIIFLLKKNKIKLKFNLRNIAFLYFTIIILIQIKNLTFSRILFFLSIIALLFFTEYLYSNKTKIYINKKLIFIIFINLSIQFFSLKCMDRKTLSWLDPNISSYFLFLFYILVDVSFNKKIYKILNIVIIIAGIFISSRSFFLSIFTYIFFKNNKIRKISEKLLVKLKINSSIILVTINIIFIIFFAQLYVKKMRPKYSYKQNITRLISFNDNSNLVRFKAIVNFKENLIKNKKLRKVGLTTKEYTKFEKIVPHNGIFELIRRFGLLLGISSLITIFTSIFYKINYKNIGYFISLLLYQTFLGIPFTGAPLLLLAYINFILLKTERDYIKIRQNKQ